MQGRKARNVNTIHFFWSRFLNVSAAQVRFNMSDGDIVVKNAHCTDKRRCCILVNQLSSAALQLANTGAHDGEKSGNIIIKTQTRHCNIEIDIFANAKKNPEFLKL
jgi:hypothetical protein